MKNSVAGCDDKGENAQSKTKKVYKWDAKKAISDCQSCCVFFFWGGGARLLEGG